MTNSRSLTVLHSHAVRYGGQVVEDASADKKGLCASEVPYRPSGAEVMPQDLTLKSQTL